MGNHGPIRDSWPIAFWGCPRGHRVEPETRCRSTQSLNFRWILSLEPERLKKSDGTSPGIDPGSGNGLFPETFKPTLAVLAVGRRSTLLACDFLSRWRMC